MFLLKLIFFVLFWLAGGFLAFFLEAKMFKWKEVNDNVETEFWGCLTFGWIAIFMVYPFNEKINKLLRKFLNYINGG